MGECTDSSNVAEKRYWVSFLNGMQRTVLVTCNKDVVREIEAIGDFEHIQTEMNFTLDGIGLSVVNDLTRNELMYFCICRYLRAPYFLFLVIMCSCRGGVRTRAVENHLCTYPHLRVLQLRRRLEDAEEKRETFQTRQRRVE